MNSNLLFAIMDGIIEGEIRRQAEKTNEPKIINMTETAPDTWEKSNAVSV